MRPVQPQVWEKGDDFKTGEVKLQIERSSDSVTVTVLECQQLKRMDGLLSKNDAYVVVKLNEREPQRTPTLENENNPVWEEENVLVFEGIDKINQLIVSVFDEDKKGDDDEIGSVTLVSQDGQLDPGVLGLEEKERSEAWAHPETRWFIIQEDAPRDKDAMYPLHARITSNDWCNDPWHALFRAHEWVTLQEVDSSGHITSMNFVRLDEKSVGHTPVAFDWRAESITGHPIYQHAVDSVEIQDQSTKAPKAPNDDQVKFANPLISTDEDPEPDPVSSSDSGTPDEILPADEKNPELLANYIRVNFNSKRQARQQGEIYTEAEDGFSTFNFGGLDMKDEDLLELLPHLLHAESPEFISFAGNDQLTDASLRPLFHALKAFPELSLLASGARGHHSQIWAVQSAMWSTNTYRKKYSKQMELVTEMRKANGKRSDKDKEAAAGAVDAHESGIDKALARKQLHLTHKEIEALVDAGLSTPEAVDKLTAEDLLEYGVDLPEARKAFTVNEKQKARARQTLSDIPGPVISVVCPADAGPGSPVNVEYAGQTFEVQVQPSLDPSPLCSVCLCLFGLSFCLFCLFCLSVCLSLGHLLSPFLYD